MTFEDITIEQYIKAKWRGDRSIITTDEELKDIETEYIDAAGLYESEEFSKVCYIHYLNNRINSVNLSIELQMKFLDEFGVPNIAAFSFLKKFGHTVVWKGNKEEFKKMLERIASKEKKYVSMLEKNIKELGDIRKNKNANKPQEEKTDKEVREAFIRTLISLGKVYLNLNRKETMLDEMAYMIKQQSEERENIENSKRKP